MVRKILVLLCLIAVLTAALQSVSFADGGYNSIYTIITLRFTAKMTFHLRELPLRIRKDKMSFGSCRENFSVMNYF